MPIATWSRKRLPNNVLAGLALVVLPLVLGQALSCHTLAPLPSASFSFTAVGDYGFSGDAAATLQKIGAASAVFNLALGDLSYSDSRPESDWCQFVKDNLNDGAGKPKGDPLGFGETFPFQLIVGNHETKRNDGYIDDFAACLPDRMNSEISEYGEYAREYYFDYQNTRVILVGADNPDGDDPYRYDKESKHYKWLRETIIRAKDARKWVIVGMHQVCLTMGERRGCEIGADLMNLLLTQKVDLVLQGHEHNYQRSKQLKCATAGSFDIECVVDDGADGKYVKGAGTVFVIVGTGGQSLTDVYTEDPEAGYFATWAGANVNPTKGMLKVAMSDTRLSAQFVRSTKGDFTDSFSITAADRVALLGDFPYAEDDKPAYKEMIEEINAERVVFSIHVGDFQEVVDPKNFKCTAKEVTDNVDLFDEFAMPLVYTPGDNDWTDCKEPNPRVSLTRLRNMVFRESLGTASRGSQTMRLISQEGFPENARWSRGVVSFATVHVVGPNDGTGPGLKAGYDEQHVDRREADIAWVHEVFAEARRRGDKGVVLIGHAAMWENTEGCCFRCPTPFNSLLKAMLQETVKFSGQVLYVHGDCHQFQDDNPTENSDHVVPNFRRVQVYGWKKDDGKTTVMKWLLLTIDPDTEKLFSVTHPRGKEEPEPCARP